MKERAAGVMTIYIESLCDFSAQNKDVDINSFYLKEAL